MMDKLYGKNEIAAEMDTPYTMHTATLKMLLTYQDMRVMKETMLEELDGGINVKKYFKDKNSPCKTEYKFLVSERWGFNYIKFVKCETNGCKKYWVEVKINPRAMMHRSDHPFVYVADKRDIEGCIAVLDSFWKEVGLGWIDTSLFYIQRIDYCVNIDLGNEDAAGVYMRLLRKGAYPYSAKRMKEYSRTGKRYIDTKNSFTVTSRSFEFSLYSKYKQLKSEEEKYPADEIDRAKGIIRIELRINRCKVKNEAAKHDLQDVDTFLKETSQIAKNNIPRYLAQSYGKGRFVTIQEAKRKIAKTNWKKKTKDEMEDILRIVSRRDLEYVKEIYGDRFSYYMEHFDQIEISPITLTSNSVYEWMPRPLYYIEHHCANTEG